MTGAERASLERLEDRLFGHDGTGGAIGRLTREVQDGFASMNGRVKTIEAKHIAEEAVDGERRIGDERKVADRRWRIGVIAGLIVSIGFQIVGFFVGK